MKPKEEFLFDPDPEIGGATVPIVGMPGSGKTIGLVNIGLNNLQNDNIVMWRGTQQCQWGHFLANDTEVVLWNHEAIENYQAYISAHKPGEEPDNISLEEKGVTVRTWNTAEELVDNLERDVVNVINVPGLEQDTKKDLYFFRKIWLDIFDALIQRQWLDIVTFLFDEIGDVVPSQQQLREPFYKLVAELLPPKLSQLRKQNVFLYGACHSTHDVHYFLWKIKSNTIMYMSGAVVKKKVTPSVAQGVVSNLKRGEFVFPPADKDHFKGVQSDEEMINEVDDLEWVPSVNGRELRLQWDADCPDLLNEDDDEMDVGDVAAKLYEEGVVETQRELADVLPVSQSQISQKVSD